ncbi:epidermis-specific secreted glycoprotein EP1-like protein [Cinnamomum micranthum f. kanehirae]|uniref:Epidermis-specific secreted glycoprotein EP1-like protein n=1 Tax=Cinnamomum micranthum f. kanehirae TaxID=337451 RepID=A0A443PEP7_9MAGN|nr:epidermis-specific secreted glycoprotein EP1-like protein [Cinnamomum micranthum f. kanehirae]
MVECRDGCSKDCKCVGFSYRKESSKCLTTPVLDTLIKVDNSRHLAFIKISHVVALHRFDYILSSFKSQNATPNMGLLCSMATPPLTHPDD